MRINPASIAKSWRRFLIDLALCREYPTFFSIASPTVRSAPRNPVLEEILPSLLHIKAVTVLDEGLATKLDEKGEQPRAHGFRNDLNGRLETASKVGLIADATVLHRIRGLRNDVAHEFAEKVTWTQLDADVTAIHSALQQLGYVGAQQTYHVTAERVPKSRLVDPKAVLGFDYTVAVQENGQSVANITWSEEILGLGEE